MRTQVGVVHRAMEDRRLSFAVLWFQGECGTSNNIIVTSTKAFYKGKSCFLTILRWMHEPVVPSGPKGVTGKEGVDIG